MHGDILILLPLMGLTIPIIAILSNSVQKLYQMKLDQHRRVDSASDLVMKKRLEDLEQRVLTLQDIIIGGDYEVRRRLEQAIASQNTVSPSAHDPHATQSGAMKTPTMGS